MEDKIKGLSFADKCRAVLDIESTAKKLAERAAEITSAKRELEAQEVLLRESILSEMTENGVVNAEECGLVFAVQNKPKSVLITDEAQIPEEYFRIKREINKTAINDAVKEGKAVPGTALGNGGQTLAIRAKGRK